MKVKVNLGEGRLLLNGAAFPAGNRVRSLRDGTRRSCEVIRSIPDAFPYDPLPFPKGLWQVTGIDWQKDKGFDCRAYGPVKIRTDAWQWVHAWELDADGDYLRETAQLVKDTCYWLHYSPSPTTLGCIRLAKAEDAVTIGRILEKALKEGPVELEVT
jgi:hypothetical protein